MTQYMIENESKQDMRITEIEEDTVLPAGATIYPHIQLAAQAFLDDLQDHPEIQIPQDDLRTIEIYASGRW